MKRIIYGLVFALGASSFSANAQTKTTGDQTVACAVILCLSAAATGRPSECVPPIQRFLSIALRTPWKTLQARQGFLKLCPAATETQVQRLSTGTGVSYSSNPTTREEIVSELAALREELATVKNTNDSYTSFLVSSLNDRISELQSKLEALNDAPNDKGIYK